MRRAAAATAFSTARPGSVERSVCSTRVFDRPLLINHTTPGWKYRLGVYFASMSHCT